MFNKFKKDECGASLVEYAVALIVVTIMGGAGIIAMADNAGSLAGNASTAVESARVLSEG